VGVRDLAFLPQVDDSPGVRADLPGKHVHQGRLPGPIFTNDSMDLTSVDVYTHLVESLNSRETLADSLQVYYG
jgi:hypothetical protein